MQEDVLQRVLRVYDVDVWRAGAADGSVDFRVGSELFQQMKKGDAGLLKGCSEAGNVEELVSNAERKHFNRTLQDDWFERYVREMLCFFQCLIFTFSPCHSMIMTKW